MTDEGRIGEAMDAVEIANAMQNVASAARRFYDELRQQDFTETQALKLTAAWIHGAAGGKLEGA